MTKTDRHAAWRTARLPFGEWLYAPRDHSTSCDSLRALSALGGPFRCRSHSPPSATRGATFAMPKVTPEGSSHWGFQDILEIVASCDAHGVFGITFGGGEPLLWCDTTLAINFYDLLAELRGCGCDLSFTTSAVPKVDWVKIPRTVVPRLSVHRHQDLPRILKEIDRARNGWGRVPAVNLLVYRGDTLKTLQTTERLVQVGVNDILLLPLRPVGRAAGSTMVPTVDELQHVVQSFPIPNVKVSACCYLDNCNSTYLGCGAGDWFVNLDSPNSLKACSFCTEKRRLDHLDYPAILAALPHLPRLPVIRGLPSSRVRERHVHNNPRCHK